MASSSTSKAATMPEWQSTLLSVHPAKRSRSQKDIIRALQLLDMLDLETPKRPFDHKEYKRALKITSALLEIEGLTVGGTSMAEVKDQYHLMEEIRTSIAGAKITKIVQSMMDPNTITPDTVACVLSGACMMLIFQVTKASFVLERKVYDLNDRSQPWKHVETLHEGGDLWVLANMGPFWSKVKAAHGDSLLREVGSLLTVDEIECWSVAVAATSTICSVLREKERSEELLKKMIHNFATFLHMLGSHGNEYHQAYPGLLALARQMAATVNILTNRESFSAMGCFSNPRAARDLEEYKDGVEDLLVAMFEVEIEAAKAAVPADHARVAHALISYGVFNQNSQHGYSSSKKELISESKAELNQCKAWLPPRIYELLKIRMRCAETTIDSVREIKCDLRASPCPPSSPLRACCAGCGIGGEDKLLQCCAQCRKVYYCSRECQKKDWKIHKKVCKELAAKPAAGKK